MVPTALLVILIAIMLPVLIVLAAFVINLAQLELNRTEMYIAADAAARAGGRTLTRTQDHRLCDARRD